MQPEVPPQISEETALGVELLNLVVVDAMEQRYSDNLLSLIFDFKFLVLLIIIPYNPIPIVLIIVCFLATKASELKRLKDERDKFLNVWPSPKVRQMLEERKKGRWSKYYVAFFGVVLIVRAFTQ